MRWQAAPACACRQRVNLSGLSSWKPGATENLSWVEMCQVLQELLGAGEGGLLLGHPDRMRNEAALKPEELASALLDLITNPQERRRLGDNCRRISEEFLWRHKIQEYEESYRRTLEQFHHGQHGSQPIP